MMGYPQQQASVLESLVIRPGIQNIHHLLLRLIIQAAGWFIRKNDPRVMQHCLDQGKTLDLAPGEFCRVSMKKIICIYFFLSISIASVRIELPL